MIEVSYAEGWDLAGVREAGALLSRDAARARDAAGEPYAVVLRLPGRRVPLEVLYVSWREHYLGSWAYDAYGRRVEEADLRLLDDPARLLCLFRQSWEYGSAEAAEFRARLHRSLKLTPDGPAVRIREDHRGSRHTVGEFPDEERWTPRPEFGAWPLFGPEWAELGPLSFRTVEGPAERGEPPEPGPAGAAGRVELWTAPRPLGPGALDALFVPGTALTAHRHEPLTVLDVRPVGTLRTTGGRLVVDCPVSGDLPPRELTVRVPPGTYPVDNAWAGYAYDFMGEHVVREDVTAYRLRIGEGPVVSWEMALAAGEDPRLLREGEGYGFGTDTASGSFADAAAWPVLAPPFREAHGAVPDGVEELAEGHLRATDPATGAQLIRFPTGGDGGYTVWLGRDAAGEPVSVVVKPYVLPELSVARPKRSRAARRTGRGNRQEAPDPAGNPAGDPDLPEGSR
ncbi:DUF4241 domain-containing protein [Streptomyces sp. NPDC004111]|uniref:DUF4241 domain-containing protein n=1 Tax=Streptomyces sp. NPDC004111 TaxID=3364690 RepID=UPI0036D1F26A